MTREKAIKHLGILRVFDAPDLNEAIKMAIAALREQGATDTNVGNKCTGCRWKGVRPQKCSCCRRNAYMKDNYEVDT